MEAASAHHPNRLAALQQLHHPTGLQNRRQMIQMHVNDMNRVGQGDD